MISEDNNKRLTQVGQGTPMGALLREYWMPALLSAELPMPDCAPVRVMLLGEKLIAFRDSAGRPGLLPDACPHRGASLFYGRSDGCGLRCAYHGWKFDVGGVCLETPTEPLDSVLKHKVRARAYPCTERGGIVWAYLGRRQEPPPLPELEPNLEGMSGRVDAVMLENNWLQSLEGDIDLAHIAHLHTDNLPALAMIHRGAVRVADVASSSPFPQSPPPIEVADTPAGFAFATSPRPGTWEIGHFMFPFYANLPYGMLGSHWVVARVPMDDCHTMSYGMWRGGAAAPPEELMFGPVPCFQPRTPDWFGRFRLTSDVTNDFRLDRDADVQGRIYGQAVQDAAMTASMGPIVDRSREHLGCGDVAIIQLRQQLLSALRSAGLDGAPALNTPGAYRVKHGRIQVSQSTDWADELRRRGGAGR